MCREKRTYKPILGAYRKRFGNPGGLEARESRGLEARRLGGGARPPNTPSQEPIERGLEIQEAWKLGNLEVWRLGGLGVLGDL